MIRATPNAVRWDEINRIQYRFQALNFHSDGKYNFCAFYFSYFKMFVQFATLGNWKCPKYQN